MLPLHAGPQVVVSALVAYRLAEAERTHRAVNEVLPATEAAAAASDRSVTSGLEIRECIRREILEAEFCRRVLLPYIRLLPQGLQVENERGVTKPEVAQSRW